MTAPLDAFIPQPDIRERFSTTIRAPASLVMQIAATFDMRSIGIVSAIFWLREKLMHSAAVPEQPRQGLLAWSRGIGWGLLVEQPAVIVCGATCQPWLANVVFTPLPSQEFAKYAEPNQVKIAWTLETEALGPALTRFSHETRAVATDEQARKRFRRYWLWARFGIVTIRLLLLPAIRREAERRTLASNPS